MQTVDMEISFARFTAAKVVIALISRELARRQIDCEVEDREGKATVSIEMTDAQMNALAEEVGGEW